MPKFIPVLSKEEIEEKVIAVAEKISADYKDSDLLLLGTLKGAFIFMADLARAITIPLQIDFIGASSYGSGTSSSGKVRITQEIESDIRDKHILIVEDIVDSGLTVSELKKHLKSFGPASVKICTMIDKHERRECDLYVDYACHKLNQGFLVGYGLDYNQDYRELPAIYHLKF